MMEGLLVDWHCVPCVCLLLLLLSDVLRMRLDDAVLQLHVVILLRDEHRRTGLPRHLLRRHRSLQDNLRGVHLLVVGNPLFLRQVSHWFLRWRLDQSFLRVIIANVLMVWLFEDVALPQLALSAEPAELLQMRGWCHNRLCLRVCLEGWFGT